MDETALMQHSTIRNKQFCVTMCDPLCFISVHSYCDGCVQHRCNFLKLGPHTQACKKRCQIDYLRYCTCLRHRNDMVPEYTDQAILLLNCVSKHNAVWRWRLHKIDAIMYPDRTIIQDSAFVAYIPFCGIYWLTQKGLYTP